MALVDIIKGMNPFKFIENRLKKKQEDGQTGFVSREGIFTEPNGYRLESYSTIDVLKRFENKRAYNIDDYVKKFYKSEREAGEHLLFTVVSRDKGYLYRFSRDPKGIGTRYTFYPDGAYSFVFCINHVRNPLAILSFNIMPSLDLANCSGYSLENKLKSWLSVKVVQVQGLLGKRDVLKNILWAPLMLNLAHDFAVQANFDFFSVISYKSSTWMTVRGNKRYGLIYNGNAKKLGCKWDSKTGLYVKRLHD